MATRRSANLMAALVIAAAGRAAPAAEETSAVVAIQVQDGANLKTLGTHDGEVWLAGDGGRGDGRAGEDRPEGYPKAYPDKGESTDAWRVTKTGRGYTIRVSRARKWRGWYLSYDPMAPEKGVFLAREPTAGSYWDIDLAETAPTPIRARAAGRGWRLDYDRAGVVYQRKEPYILNTKLYKVKLSKEDSARFSVEL